MKVKLKVYDGVKYWDGTQKVAEVNYDIQGYEVKQISDEEIAAMGFDTVDEFEEYLILTLKSGETSAFPTAALKKSQSMTARKGVWRS